MSRLAAMLLALALLAGATHVAADEPATRPSDDADGPTLVAALSWGAAGFVTGFLAHESGHVVANLAFGNVPHPTFIWVLGFIPFVAIEPRIYCTGDRCVKGDGTVFTPGRHAKFEIVSAGFQVQHLTDELILQLCPDLRYRSKPFVKGLLAFNTLVSVMYAVATLTGLEADDGDVGGQAANSHLSKPVLATMLLIPAGLDMYRYFYPGSVWAPWVSIGTKVGYIGMSFTF